MFPKPSLRSSIGYVTQESFLFNGTVRDNLIIAKRDATEEELWRVLDAANALAFVERLLQKLDTHVVERGGASVSARNSASPSPGHSSKIPHPPARRSHYSVDTETERLIQEALERFMVNCTNFVIAHRLSTVRHADRIYVFNQGEIVEQAAHDELLIQNGLYADLCRKSLMAEPEPVLLPA